MNRLDQALFSTSVNASGKPALWRIDDILSAFESQVELVVTAGDRPSGVPSTIVDITESPFRLLRRGAVELPDGLLEQ
jgi:L-threonylcarbamoyladenylate synthase